MSRQVDAKRVVLVRPVLTLRLGSDDRPKEDKPKNRDVAKAPGDKPRRAVRLQDVRIEDGTVNILYDEKGTEKRIEHIAANLSLPTLTDPFTGTGKFDWKEQTVNFNFGLTSLAELREKRPAKLVLALDTPAIAARFDGSILTRPNFTGQGELSAKAHSLPSLLAWMREKPAATTAIGDGELASHVAWKKGEISFSGARFALEHASGQGQAVVTLKSPRPHIRAALALDHLDLNPFLSSSPTQAPSPEGAQPQDWFHKPGGDQSASSGAQGSDANPQALSSEVAKPASPEAAPIAPVPAPAASPCGCAARTSVSS